MLQKFSVQNFKSFENRWELDLSAVKDYQYNSSLIKNKTVKNALLYGYNGTGKSNLGFAIMDIIGNISDKNVCKQFYEYEYLNASSKQEFAEFSYTFLFDGETLEYSYRKKDAENICSERLYLAGKTLLAYDRDQEIPVECQIPGTENLDLDLAAIEIPILRYIRRNAALSLDFLEVRILHSFFHFVDRMLHFRNLDDRFYQGFKSGNTRIDADILHKGNLQKLQEFLQQANLHLELVKYEEPGTKDEKIGIKIQQKVLPFFRVASTGTRALTLFYYWYQYLNKTGEVPSLVFIDEYDAFFHTEAARLIFRKLKELENTQSILSSHNLDLFNNQDARPDCIFLLGETGMAPLWQLTDKSEIREVHNLSKLYKGGAFAKRLAEWQAEGKET